VASFLKEARIMRRGMPTEEPAIIRENDLAMRFSPICNHWL